MPCDWEGNHRSGFALAMRHSLTDISGSLPMGSRPWRGRWAPAYALL